VRTLIRKHCRPEEKDLYINEAKDNYKRNEIKKQDCCRWWRSVYYSKPDEKQEEDTDSLERCFTLGTIPFTMSEEIKVEKELGQGTYGRIFLCNWLGCTVALKVPHRKFSSDQAPSHPEVSEGPASEAFRSADLAREHALMTSLAGHPNICRTFQLLNLEDGVIALAMEVAQSDLLALCKKLRRAPEPWSENKCQIWKLFKQVLAGLVYMHAKRVLHCDIKTNNILFFPQSLTTIGRVAISDFGLSRQVGNEGRITVYGDSVYATGYRPAECLIAGERKAQGLV